MSKASEEEKLIRERLIRALYDPGDLDQAMTRDPEALDRIWEDLMEWARPGQIARDEARIAREDAHDRALRQLRKDAAQDQLRKDKK